MAGKEVRGQLRALLHKAALSRRQRGRRALVEAALPILLALAFSLVPILGGEDVVPAKTSVDRAVHLGDPFNTKYAARLCQGSSIFAIAPADGIGEEFRAFLGRRYGTQPPGWPNLVAMDDGEQVEEYATSEHYGTPGMPPLCGALIFDTSISFTVRLNGTLVGNRGAVCGGVDTRRLTTTRAIDKAATSQDWYLCSGFLALQKLGTEFLTSRSPASLRRHWDLDLDVVPFPTPPFRSRAALSATRELIALSVVLFFAYVSGRIAAEIVAEREQKLLETMRLLGLRDRARFAAQLLGAVPLLTLYALEFAVVLSLGIFSRSNAILFCAFFALFGAATAAMALSASALFDSARTASISVVVCIFAASRFGTEGTWACLVPPLALVQGLARIVELELADVGLRWSSLWDDMGFQSSTGVVMLYLAADVFLYLCLWMYFERVVPHQFGAAAQPWYRPWSSNERVTQMASHGRQQFVTRRRVSEKMGGIIQDTLPVACIVEVKDLRREFLVGGRDVKHKVVAVRKLDLGLAESEILALLGHNGAGKSTTISMLSGLLQPTSGSVTVCGHSMSSEPWEARRCLGLCPQHDVLFEDLSARDHLHLAADLRGVGESSTVAAADLLAAVGLRGAVAESVPAGSLPSGRRRALCVALAFVGEPKFVVLDEPTSGMDPFVRRTMWELVKRQRAGRALCLSTHHMDEAEMLGDQVCILSRGTLQCYGSPDWLKVRLGSGYLLTLVRAAAAQEGGEAAQAALQLLQSSAPEELRGEISVTNAGAKEIVARVPFRAARHLPTLLRALDGQKAALGIAAVTVSATTLEELFVRLADGETESLGPVKEASTSTSLSGGMAETTAADMEGMVAHLAAVSPGSRGLQQGMALLLKRWQVAKRSRRALLCLCALPLLFNVLGIASIATTFELNSPPLEVLGTGRELNPKLEAGQRVVVPFAVRNESWPAVSRLPLVSELLGAGADWWEVLDHLPTDAALHCATSRRNWTDELEVEFSFVGGQGSAQGSEDSLSKYVEMREKGAPEFVIRRVMEKDGVSSGLIERFLSGPGAADDGVSASGRVSLGLRDRIKGSLDSNKREAKLELSFGRAMLRAEATARTGIFREELVNCAAGGPAQAVKAEEAMERLDEETRKVLQAMQEGGAPAFARRAVLEKAGVAGEDIELLALVASTESIPPERRTQLQRCADWQAFAVALLDSVSANAASRYGGFYVESVSEGSKRAKVAIFQNTSAPHSAPLFLGQLQQAALLHSDPTAEPWEVEVRNWPLPLTAAQKMNAFSSQGFSFFTMALIGGSFLPATIASDLARELCSGTLRQQRIAGMSVALFTAVNLVVDILLVTPPLLSQLAFISGFQLAVYVDCLGVIAVLLVLYSFTALAQVYAFTPELKSPTGTLNVVLALNVVTGFIVATAVWVLSIPFLGSTANTAARITTLVCRVFPAFNLANALLTIPNTALPGFSVVYGMDPLAWEVTGEALAGLLFNLVLYVFLAFKRGAGAGPTLLPGPPPTDPQEASLRPQEVREEEAAAVGANRPSSGLTLQQLTVMFSRGRGRASSAEETRGVGPLSLIVQPGSVLGLLGVSGCGKSTALAALAGALPAQARLRGQAWLGSRSISGRLPRVGEVGYCPQENELTQGLSVREHTRLFGRLRGLHGALLEAEVRALLAALELGPFEASLSQNLSGGNQRKLQCACALVGGPRLVCLDEPSAGLDPVARRALWHACLARLRPSALLIVATKSIAEAEALCSKLAVLGRQGLLRSVGSGADLRARHGSGHELRVVLQRPMVSEVYASVLAKAEPSAVESLLAACAGAMSGEGHVQGLGSLAQEALAGAWAWEDVLVRLRKKVTGAEAGAGDRNSEECGELLPEDSTTMREELAQRSQRILSALERLFPGVRCIEAVSLTRVYRLRAMAGTADSAREVADIFEQVESISNELRIADYSIMQTSLEHVFNELAAQD